MIRSFALSVILMLLVTGSPAPAQDDSQRFHGSAPGHKVDYRGLFDQAQNLDSSPDGQAVLQNCLAAYGGVEKLSTLTGARIRYEVSVAPDAEPVEVVKTFQPGRKYRTVKGEDTRVINDLTCWYEHEDQVAELNDTRYRAELFSYLTLTMPLTAKTERFDQVRYGKRPNDPLDYLYFDKADSLLIILGIDPVEHLIRSSTGVIPQGEKEFVYINEFSGFKEHEGFIFPAKVIYYSLGMRVGQFVVREVEINPVFQTGEFYPRNKSD